MKAKLPAPYAEAMIYEDKKAYACLANFPIAPGHVVVVRKKDVKDVNALSRKEYDYFMDIVFKVRMAMLKALKVKKVYMMYMDEIEHVHIHLVPRYHEQGFGVFTHVPGTLTDFSLDKKIIKYL